MEFLTRWVLKSKVLGQKSTVVILLQIDITPGPKKVPKIVLTIKVIFLWQKITELKKNHLRISI